MKHFIIVKHNRPFFRPVIAISYGDRKVSLGEPDSLALPFSLEEATAIVKKLRFTGYDALVWSRKD